MKKIIAYIKTNWVMTIALVIMFIIILIFIFRHVETPSRSGTKEMLRQQLDSAVREHARQETINAIRDSVRQKENEDLRSEINSIKGQIKSNNVYHEKIIRELYSADAAELERFFSDRYQD